MKKMSHYVIKGRLQLLYILSMHTQADFAPVNACQTSLPKNYIRVANSRTLPGITLTFYHFLTAKAMFSNFRLF